MSSTRRRLLNKGFHALLSLAIVMGAATACAAPSAQPAPNAQALIQRTETEDANHPIAASQPLKDPHQYILLREQRTDLPSATPSLPFTVCDLNGDGDPEVIQAVSRGGAVKTVSWIGSDGTILDEIPALASPISRITPFLLQRGRGGEILISTSETGAAYVYGLLDGSMRRLSQTPHVWSSLSHAVPLSLDSDDGRELLCMAENGQSCLYKQTSQGWLRLWRGTLTADILSTVVSTDIDGDGVDEIIGSSSSGKVTVFQYQYGSFKASQEMSLPEPLDEMQVQDLDKDGRPELVGRSRLGNLLVLKWEAGSLRISSRYSLPDTLGSVFLMGDVDGDRQSELFVGGKNHQLSLYRWEGMLLRSLGKVLWTEDLANASWGESMGLVLMGASGTLSKVALTREDHIRVEMGGTEYKPVATPLLKDGRVFLCSRDLTNLFGLSVAWDQSNKITTISKKGISMGLKADSTEYYVGSARASDKLEAAPINQDGRLFVPLRPLIRNFNLQMVWKPEMRLLSIPAGR